MSTTVNKPDVDIPMSEISDKETTDRPKNTSGSNGSTTVSVETENLANLISGVLRHNGLPEPLSDGFRDALTTFFNERIDQTELDEYQTSEEYIGQLLRGYQRRAAEA